MHYSLAAGSTYPTSPLLLDMRMSRPSLRSILHRRKLVILTLAIVLALFVSGLHTHWLVRQGRALESLRYNGFVFESYCVDPVGLNWVWAWVLNVTVRGSDIQSESLFRNVSFSDVFGSRRIFFFRKVHNTAQFL